MKRFIFITLFIVVFISMVSMRTTFAISIVYEATDLSDTTPGEDVWQYTYWLSDYTFNTGYGFTIYFDYQLYSNLEDPPPAVNSDWDPIVWQPDSSLPDDGAYDALALVDNASLADPFTISFVWLGSWSPGGQYFEVYDSSFNTVASGQTAPVPEPATFLLISTGLLGLAGFKKKFGITRG
ncbi:MAG TPA: PEP-CTERM sorting domain-containing protein [Methylophaga sp.]|nr:PEP-CTERM sorting domain-containing protein [Methylophaga sp.]